MVIVFTFTGSAIGSPNPVTIPQTAQGQRELEIIPPVGHAWTLYDASGKTGAALSMDRTKTLYRTAPSQPAFTAGESVAAVALDSGSGTFVGILS